MRKLVFFVALLASSIFCPALRAQLISTVRIYATAPGARFYVDGVPYISTAEFAWPVGSKHIVDAEAQDVHFDRKYVYDGWRNNLGDAHTVQHEDRVPANSGPLTFAITADPNLRWVEVSFTLYWWFTLNISPECAPGMPCVAPGFVEDTPFGTVRQTVSGWVPDGMTVRLTAHPDPGAVFVGWVTAKNLAPALPTTYVISFPVVEPTVITCQFMPAVAVTTTVTLITAPPQLKVIVDGTEVEAPRVLEWGWNTYHTFGATPVQHVGSITYAFDSWTDGGPLNREMRVPSPANPMTFTAHFVPAHTIRFTTSPPNLRLTIDGGQDSAGTEQGWAPGSVHTISAPSTQTDLQGRRYRFVSWSNAKSPSFDYTAGPAGQAPSIVATYQLLGQATIVSSLPSLSVEVDGSSCATPCKIERDAGTTVRVVAPVSIPNGDQSRTLFRGWLDAETATRSIELTGEPKTYTLSYAAQSRVSIAAEPAEGASFAIEPFSPDGFYDNGAVVSVTANPALGFRIRNWAGDVSAAGGRAAIAVNSPKSVLLFLDRVPAIAPAGVRNAASAAAAGPVAPGSLISIFGGSLAPALEVGPTNPLSQTLRGVTVRVDDTFLPLIFVAPDQINAQLSSTLTPGVHTLVVRVEGRPEVSAPVEVARNAPGLFNKPAEDLAAGVFVHANGQAVTREAPARAGEVVSIFGTGLGPYLQTPPDGFWVEEAAAFSLKDAVELLVAGERVIPAYAGRATAVGTDVVRFTVPATRGSGWAPVQLTVNSIASNVVFLPVDPAE